MPRTYSQNGMIEENMPRRDVYYVAPNDRSVRDPSLTFGGFLVACGTMGKQSLDCSQARETQRRLRIEGQDKHAEGKPSHDYLERSNETDINQQSEDDHGRKHGSPRKREIGRASCRERVEITEVAVAIK